MTHVVVEVPLPDRKDWPTAQPSQSPGIKADIETKTPHLPFVLKELRTIQGLLSMFGLHSFDLKSHEVEWVPESDEEKEALPVYSFKHSFESLKDEEIPVLPFEFIARSIIAADAAAEIEVPLNFFRRGMLDMYDRNYIDAVYDFYFVLENLFAGGKFRKPAVLNAFRNSDQLRLCVEEALSEPGLMINQADRTREEFRSRYGSASVEKVLEMIFDLRGNLHHHTQKQRESWHPDDQHQFECDAMFLQKVVFNVISDLAKPYLWNENVTMANEKLARNHRE